MNLGARTGQSRHHSSTSPPLVDQLPTGRINVCKPQYYRTRPCGGSQWWSTPEWGVSLILGFSIAHRRKPHSPISALSVIKMVCQSPSVLLHTYLIKTHARKAGVFCTCPCGYHLLYLSSVMPWRKTIRKNIQVRCIEDILTLESNLEKNIKMRKI